MKIYKIPLYSISLFLFIVLVFKGNSSIQYTNISQRSLTVGDQIELTVALVIPPGSQIVPPETENGFGAFVVKQWSTTKVERESSDSITYSYIITSYEVVQCTIPPLPFIEYKNEKKDTLFSDILPMLINSVIIADSGDTVKFKDIKPQQIAGSPSLLWLWILVSFLCLVGLIILIRYLWIRSRKPPPPPPPKPPYDEAVEALAELQRKDLVLKGFFREYIFELSEILKRYIGRQFESNAAEFTTEEMLDYISTAPFNAECGKSMEWFFHTTHPVKFAKMIPEHEIVKKLYTETVSFIQKTKPPLDVKRKPEGKKGDDSQ